MMNLQSKDMPFRTINKFYQPSHKERPLQSIKTFPQKHHNTTQQLIAPQGDLPSVFTYLTSINQARHLPRRVANKYQYYPHVKSCRRHLRKDKSREGEGDVDNAEEENSNLKSRFQTLMSNNPSNRSMMVFGHVTREQKKIGQEKMMFRQTRSLKRDEKDKQMRFSFYNTIEKSEHFLRKYKQDSSLDERKTNNYQNMFKRTITAENILSLLDKSKAKYKTGK